MKKIILLILLVSVVLQSPVSGAFLRNVPQRLVQPDGTILNCLATGDEFHSWLHDINNFTIIRNPETGFYVYADIIDGKITTTEWVAGEADPSGKGLVPGLNISPEQYYARRSARESLNKMFKSSKPYSTKGEMQNLVVFIRFQDQPEFNQYRSLYENALNGAGMVSLKSYFKIASQEQLVINSHMYPGSGNSLVVSYQDPHPRSYYQPYNAASNPGGYMDDNESAAREQTLLRDATEFVREEIESSEIDLDMDDDGMVDNIVFIVKGGTEGWNNLLWPHKWTMFKHEIYLKGAKIGLYNFQLSGAFSVSVLCHEMFHSLGAPDLYRYDKRKITPVGPWDLMAETTTPPQHMTVYSKMKYGGWIDEIHEIDSPGTYTLEPLANNPFAAYKIKSPNSSDEFFILEYRSKAGQFESSLPGSGLIIYRVNTKAAGNSGGPPDEIYVFRPDGTNTSNGDIYNAFFSTQSSRVVFNDNTNPGGFLSNGTPGGIKITNIGYAGASISFEVEQTGSFNPPVNLTASASGSNVRLNWQKPAEGFGGLSYYKVFRNGDLIASPDDPELTSFTDKDLAEGTYSYYLTAVYIAPEGESSSSNRASAVIGSSGKPDLIISGAEVNPLTANPGDNINVHCRLINNGTGRAGPSVMRLVLSADQNFDSGDPEIAYGSMEALDPGKYIDIYGDGLEVPQNISTGSWFLLFIADADKQVEESEENNNLASKSITIGSSGFEPPVKLTATSTGNIVHLQWLEPPSGKGILTGYRVFRNGVRITSINNVSNREFSDRNLSNGNYTYYITALYISPHGESGPSNEVSLEISTALRPDLLINNPKAYPARLRTGESIDVECNYVNTGKAPSEESMLRLFLSRDHEVDPDDIDVANGGIEALNPGESVHIDGSQINIPEGLGEGVWYLLFKADADEEISESDEQNNISYVQLSFDSTELYPPGHLDASVSQAEVTLSWDAPQEGSAVFGAYRVYRNGILIHTINNPAATDYIDRGLGFGEYQYYVTAFYLSPEGESKPSNTQKATIRSSSRPDLIILNQSVAPYELNPGDYISVDCDFFNNGTSSSGACRLGIYLSKDLYIDINDIEIAYGNMDVLDAGLYFDINGEDIYVPADLPHGQWNVLFYADSDNQVEESVETNNVSGFQIKVGSTGFNPPENLNASVAGRNVYLNWTKPAIGNGILMAYKLYRNGLFIAQISDTENISYEDHGIPPGTYEYHVTALYSNPSGESGVSNKALVNIGSENLPDLIIREPGVSPVKTDPGSIIDINCKLHNEGIAGSDESLMLVVISSDQLIDAGDLSLAYGSIGKIASEEYIEIGSTGIELPDDLNPGMWYIGFIADYENHVNETNEDNNVSFVELEIEASDLNPPENLYATVSGINVSLHWQAPEPGPGTLSSFIIYRNGMEINRLNDVSKRSYADIGLNPGIYSYYVTSTYSNPAGESGKSNTATVEIISSDEPDLTVAGAEVSPYQLDPGGTISVSCIIRNLGGAEAPESMMRLYISADKHADENDVELASGIMGSLDPGGYLEVSGRDLVLPSSVTNGLWNVVFYVDSDQQVIESNESNNEIAIPVVIGESIFNPPENLQAVLEGNSIMLFWNIPVRSEAALKGYNIYRDGIYYAYAGAGDQQPFIDNGLDFGYYSYFITAVYENPEGESTASNEVIIAISSEVKPDLIIREAKVSPAYVDPGGILSVSCKIRNIGSSQAGYSQVKLFLSPNITLDIADQELAYGSIDPIAPGEGLDIKGEDLKIPEWVSPGEWFLFFVADGGETIDEADEENNFEYVKVSVAASKPDLMLTRIYLIRDHVNPGDMMRMTFFVYNNGSGDSGKATVSFYLSQNETLDGDDVYLNETEIDSLGGMEQVFKNNYVTIPENTVRKNYFLIAYIDVNQDISETDENNNTFAVPVAIGTSGISETDFYTHLNIYPVPATREINVEYGGMSPLISHLTILDEMGRVIFHKDLVPGTYLDEKINVEGWPKGYYFVRFTIQGSVQSKVFLKL